MSKMCVTPVSLCITHPQSPPVSTARRCEDFSSWHWNSGLGSLVWGQDPSLFQEVLHSQEDIPPILDCHAWMWNQPVLHLRRSPILKPVCAHPIGTHWPSSRPPRSPEASSALCWSPTPGHLQRRGARCTWRLVRGNPTPTSKGHLCLPRTSFLPAFLPIPPPTSELLSSCSNFRKEHC